MKIRCNYSEKSIEVGEVKPCPFCGEADDLTLSNPDIYEELVAEDGSSVIIITCEKCKAELHQHDVPRNNYMMGAMMLIERWNHRA